MSKATSLNELNDETLGRIDKGEAKQLSSSRRRFLRNVTVGAAGATIAMGRPDRVLARQTQNHVNLFFGPVTSYALTPATKQAFLNVASTVLRVVNEGGDAKSSYDAIRSYIAKPLVSIPSGQSLTELGLSRDESNTIAVAYLRAMAALSSTSLSENDIRQGLSNPKAIFDRFESDFVSQLFDKTKAESMSSASLAQKLADATTQFKAAADELSSTGVIGRVVSRNSLIKPVSFNRMPVATPLQACSINGTPIPHWQVCVALVVVVVVAILAK